MDWWTFSSVATRDAAAVTAALIAWQVVGLLVLACFDDLELGFRGR